MALKITILGKVHNVGYRLFLLEEADYLLIPRFDSRNIKIGGKEALVVLVDGATEQLEKFVEFVKTNKPEKAVVEEIKVEEFEGPIRDIEKFRASFNTTQLSKIVEVGLRMIEKQDLMLKKQDTMIEKQDTMIEKQDLMLKKQDTMIEKQDLMLKKQDTMIEKQDLMLKKQDETINEIRATREELKKEVREISSKLDKTNELLERRFEKLEEEIEKIKRALIKAGIEL